MPSIEVKVPDIGDFDEVSVIELLVKPGDAVKAEQSLLTVESDKASMEIPASQGGVVKELKVKLGDKVKEGTVIAMVEVAGAGGGGGGGGVFGGRARPAPCRCAGCCSRSPGAGHERTSAAGQGW